ncbi:MAG: U32 family peptidase [Bacilli bacterium]|nr:U32 family peptidase [Bacilli bacterium]
MKKELLVPAGNFESLMQAVHNGCDAVYVGGIKFGARKFANNFDDLELAKAIKYCHLYGVKIYVTVNTIIYEKEIDEVLSYVKFLYDNGVDAVIMQDLGLITKVRKIFPNLEVHASTQLHNHNKEDLLHLKELGVKRVVLARELSIEEVKKLEGIIDLEIFIHGALCISYSGQCLFSSMVLDRSGNRGECAGFCRLPYNLIENDKKIDTKYNYLLSPKEISTINEFDKLMELGVVSFKIEGRMKSPYYVGFITRLYRMAIDSYNDNKKFILDDENLKKLMVLYNREFSKGHLFKEENYELMNIKSPNHIGIKLGEVIEIGEFIKIKLSEDVNQEDGIRFISNNTGMILNFLYNEKGLLINKASKGEIILVDNKIGLEELGMVYKTLDHKLNKELSTYELKRVPIKIKVIAKLDKELGIEVDDYENNVSLQGNIISSAINNPTTIDRIKEQVLKLGNTPFICNDITLDMDDNLFIPIKEINELRREVIENLIYIRENKKREVIILEESKDKVIPTTNKKLNINILVRNEKQLKAAIDKKVNNIYVTDIKLYNEYKDNKNIYLRLDRVSNNIVDYNNSNLLVGELGSFYKYKNNKLVSDYYFNVVNSLFANYLINNNVDLVTLSVENKLDQLIDILKNVKDSSKCEVIIYGTVELMVMKHCPLNMLVNKEDKCSVCRGENNYYLEDRNREKYKIINDKCITHIMNSRVIDRIDYIKDLKKNNCFNYRIELFEEDYNETIKIINKIEYLLNN